MQIINGINYTDLTQPIQKYNGKGSRTAMSDERVCGSIFVIFENHNLKRNNETLFSLE